MLRLYNGLESKVYPLGVWAQLASHLIILLRTDNIIKVSLRFLFNKVQYQLLMSLLPKNHAQFKEKQYWEGFFKKLRQKQAFEWYGSFQAYRESIFFALMQLSQLEGKRKNFRIANLGCGNSTLPKDLIASFPAFQINVDSFDYSAEVIIQMNGKNTDQKLSYAQCDLLKPVEIGLENKYEVVLDKGTLDAMLPEQSMQNILDIREKYFLNIRKMLNKNSHSSYIIISMLQSFVLKTILSEFLFDPHFSVRISERWIPDSQMQPFFVELRYYPKGGAKNPQIALLNKTILNPTTIQSFLYQIEQVQRLNRYTKSINQLRVGQLSKFSILVPHSQSIRFKLQISDHKEAPILNKNSCAVFIVPQGMQNLETFDSQIGLKDLHDQVGTSRLIVVKLVVGQKYSDIEAVKKELDPILPNLIQKGCIPKDVPYLTHGSLGQRYYLFEDQEIFIEDIKSGEEAFRRLILKDSPDFIQSQLLLKYASSKNNPEIPQSLALPKKKGMTTIVDHSFLKSGYCRWIVAGVNTFAIKQWNNLRFLHLGGGGAAIPCYLFHKLPNSSHLIVEQSKSVINSSKYFNWPKDPRFTIICKEAHSFTNQIYNSKQEFEVIILDISCNPNSDQYPPLPFVSEDYLKKIQALLVPSGLLIINHINEGSSYQIKKQLKIFSTLAKSQKSGSNQIWVCVNTEEKDKKYSQNKIIGTKSKSLLNLCDWKQDEKYEFEIIKTAASQFDTSNELKIQKAS